MSFPKAFLDELKGRIRVSEVVGRKVKLIRRGREFVGLSPFSNEKSPSFTVNDDKQFFHCFSSGEHGDVIKFLEKTENLSFIEAVERLAAEAGMEMPKRDSFVAEREKEAATLIDVMEMAAQFFRQKLQEGAGAEARAYLDRRGMKAKTLDDFGVGYAPGDERADRTALMRYLKSRDVTQEQMAEAGLIISGPDIREPHDRFRNRVMFPIADARGRVIAFGGRALASDAKAKYLNSPDTPLFHKGRVLYNLNRARKPAYDEGTVIAVEGYMDVIGLSQGGIDNAVAPLGTALTEDQIALLWRMAPEPILCFDGDKAGLRAAYRAVERVLPLLKPGHSLRFALLPEGKDPDDLVREEGGQAMRDILAKARPLAEMVWEKEISAGQWDTPERRAKLEADLEAAVATISDPKVRGHYSDNLRAKVQQFFGGSARGGQRAGLGQNRFPRGQFGRPFKKGTFNRDRDYIPPITPELRRSALASGGGGERSREALLLLTLLNHPELLENYAEEVSRVEIGTPALDRLRNEIIDIAALHAPLEREALRNHLLSRDLAEIARRLEAGSAFKSDRFAWPDAAPDEAEAGFLHTLARHRRAIVLQAELKAAERALAEEMTEENFARLQAIHAQLERSEVADGLG
ncbi:DNA primase [Parvibaculum lavamentivorans DS-1]|uniref:DNA primase n=1 Tax=Parvibaculum lavamentivorans (strain DS-1 / DSM 13023 / NCIMB 13966) TaxID=402881 RepID=A7HVJ7_PARL1|nr:DNA primase [Parvibaculum lavamentivorans]ABS63930.1 DNA primase [Parvibaculum lavamentivorans DS-1]